MVRARGLEPPWGKPHTDLNRTRLPIPPRPRVARKTSKVDITPASGRAQELFLQFFDAAKALLPFAPTAKSQVGMRFGLASAKHWNVENTGNLYGGKLKLARPRWKRATGSFPGRSAPAESPKSHAYLRFCYRYAGRCGSCSRDPVNRNLTLTVTAYGPVRAAGPWAVLRTVTSYGPGTVPARPRQGAAATACS